ncbi:MAG: hypothetical protein H6668_07085 [Ardenticatenaceae bacterium]|nr:hypothetical protein [Ardenticatenaceae bacterium]
MRDDIEPMATNTSSAPALPMPNFLQGMSNGLADFVPDLDLLTFESSWSMPERPEAGSWLHAGCK